MCKIKTVSREIFVCFCIELSSYFVILREQSLLVFDFLDLKTVFAYFLVVSGNRNQEHKECFLEISNNYSNENSVKFEC